MRIVLDSNVIIAAFAARGLCSELFELCLNEHDIVLCDGILEEVKKGLLHKVKAPESTVKEIIGLLKKRATIIEPAAVDSKECRDKDDLVIIGVAIRREAEVIVSGDKDLLVLKHSHGIKILSPRDFWEYLRNK